MRLNIYTFIFIFIFKTEWNEAAKSSEDVSRFWSVLTDSGTNMQTSSHESSETSRTWKKSNPSRSFLEDTGRRNNMHQSTGVVYEGSGHGSPVTTFQHTASTPSLWLRSSLPVASDKEVARLPQEALHNNPDTSGDAAGRSHISATFGHSLTHGYGQAGTAVVVPHQKVPETWPSTAHSSTAVPVTQSLASRTQAVGFVAVPEHAELPSFSDVQHLSVVPSALHSSVTPKVPSSAVPNQWRGESGYAHSAVDSTLHKWSSEPKLYPSITSYSSQMALSGTETGSVPSASHLLPGGYDQTSGRQPLSPVIPVGVGDTSTNYYIRSNYKYFGVSSSPRTGELESTKMHSIPLTTSHSLQGFSQGPSAATVSESFVERASRSVTEQELPSRSRSEDGTNWGTELGHTSAGHSGRTDIAQIGSTYESSLELSTSYAGTPEAESLNATLPDDSWGSITHVDTPNSMDVLRISNGVNTEQNVYVQSTATVVPKYQFNSVTPYTGLNDAEMHSVTSVIDSYTEMFVEELPNTDIYVSKTSVTPPDSTVRPQSPDILTTLPDFSGSPSSDNNSLISVPEKTEISSVPESKTDLDLNLQNSISTSSPQMRTQLTVNSTVSATVAFYRETTSENKFNDPLALSTHSAFEQLTSIPFLVTVSPTLNLRTSPVSNGPLESTFTSTKGDSKKEHVGTEYTTQVFSHTVTPLHTFTVTSVESEKDTQSIIAVSSTVASTPASPGQKVSSTVTNSISSSSHGISPTVPSSHIPLVTVSPTAATVGNTGTVLVTPPPRTTSKAPRTYQGYSSTKNSVPTGTSSIRVPVSRTETASSSSGKAVKVRIFIVEDQPPIIKEEIVQLLLQVVLTSESLGNQQNSHLDSVEQEAVVKLRLFLEQAPGFQDLHLSWTSGTAVVQSVATFNTERALSWLGVPGALLDLTGLNKALRQGIYVNGIKVENITVGGLQPNLCSWLLLCPLGFQCEQASVGKASCTSLCHTDYCKNHGICTHHHGQQPVCQCPVGEDFWFMGRQCDFQMTRQRLVGVCLGVLFSVVLLMVATSFLVIRHFKAMLIQAKVDQTRSSYRRFNHFDELSGRFWLRSWPGSADSLDNPAFSRSDELLHLRALDRSCCYHDDSLSIVSTCHGSGTHVNTIYAHGSQYNWNVSSSSINEFVADSGKASDLSVCSWPIEPIQWTPFPLLQQLGVHRPAKTSRPRSYCEGMELVDLEKTWTA